MHTYFMALTLIIAITISRTVPIYDNLESFNVCACAYASASVFFPSGSFSIYFTVYRFMFKSQSKREKLPESRRSNMVFILFCVWFFICSLRLGRFFVGFFFGSLFSKIKHSDVVVIIITISLSHLSRLFSHIQTNLFHTCIAFCRHHATQYTHRYPNS